MSRFTAIGLLVGPRLPDGTFWLGEVGIRPLLPEEAERLAMRATVGSGVSGLSAGVSVLPPRVQVHSRWMARFELEAPSPSEAQDVIEGVIIPRFLGALDTIADRPYAFETVRLLDAEGHELWSGGGAFFYYGEPETVPGHELAQAAARLALLTRHSKAAAAVAHLTEGSRLAELAPVVSPYLGRGALLEMCLAIEVATSEMAADVRSKNREKIDEAQHEIAAQLARDLAASERTAGPGLVREAASAIDRANWKQIDLQVELVGQEFGLDREVVADARELMKLRNQRLAHGGEPAADLQPQIDPWIKDHRAFRVARRFVAAYLDSVARDAT